MSGRVPVYLFRDGRLATNTVVSLAARDVVVSVYGGGGIMDGDGLSKAFGGYCVFRKDETGAYFLGVWGNRNASRFRSAIRRGGLLLEIVRAPPSGRLVLYCTGGIRPGKPPMYRPPDLPTLVEDETNACRADRDC